MYYENPAFDWNHKTEKPSIEVNAIFSNFNLAVQYAPCIVFKNILVCGESIEVNCLSDLMVDLTTDELSLFYKLQSDLLCLLGLAKVLELVSLLFSYSILNFQIHSENSADRLSDKKHK